MTELLSLANDFAIENILDYPDDDYAEGLIRPMEGWSELKEDQ